MTDISIVADIPLLHTIAQTSATFVAIVAGFYTTKIISLSNEQRRILQRINELDNELQEKTVYYNSLKRTESETENRWDEEIINGFIEHITGDFYAYEQIKSIEDLREWFPKLYDQPLTENQDRILKERASKILAELENKRNERKGRSTLREVTVNPVNPGESFHVTLSTQAESDRHHRLKDRIRDIQAEILSLKRMKEYNQLEYQSIAYPRLIKFGFVSLITFAILGVIFPLTYRWWVITLFTYSNFNANLLVVIMFIIGLSITFLYIGLELFYATLGNNKNKTRMHEKNKNKKEVS